MIPSTYTLDNAIVIQLTDELDADTLKTLRSDLTLFSELDNDLLLDMTDVTFIDSSGIGAIVYLYKRLSASGHSLAIVNVSGQPERLFEMLHLAKTIPCFATLYDYMNWHKAPQQKAG